MSFLNRIFGGHTPDITAAQVSAALAWVATQAVAYGWMSPGNKQYILSIGATVIAPIWALADSIIRHGRATGGVIPKNPPAPKA